MAVKDLTCFKVPPELIISKSKYRVKGQTTHLVLWQIQVAPKSREEEGKGMLIHGMGSRAALK